MTALNKQALREAAEKATPGRVGDRIDGSGSIKYECHGYDGSLVLRTDHKNMEYGFIGDNGDADELFFRLCVPDVIIALLDELEAVEKRIPEMESRTVNVHWPAPKYSTQGWKVDPEFISKVQGAIGYDEECQCWEGTPSMEMIEAVLIAAAGIGVKGE